MHIDIHIPRPLTTLLLVAAVSGWGVILFGNGSAASVIPPVGQVSTQTPSEDDQAHDEIPPTVPAAGDDVAVQTVAAASSSSSVHMNPALAVELVAAERRALEARAAQQLMREREAVIRYQLEVLKEQREKLGTTVDEALEDEFRNSTRLLLTLLQDQRKAEQFILASLHQIWEADGRAIELGKNALAQGARIVLAWPVDPESGISAGFLDQGYEQRFKFKHYGVDIPVLQGSVVRAAASGTVKDVVDHGLGFSYITIEHPGGFATLYGHLSKLTVQPGQMVAAGDAIGLSGGMPGTAGAGFSTGPHVHFGLYVGGKAIDPKPYLPSL